MLCKEYILKEVKKARKGIDRVDLIKKTMKKWSMNTIEHVLRELVWSEQIKKIKNGRKVVYKI